MPTTRSRSLVAVPWLCLGLLAVTACAEEPEEVKSAGSLKELLAKTVEAPTDNPPKPAAEPLVERTAAHTPSPAVTKRLRQLVASAPLTGSGATAPPPQTPPQMAARPAPPSQAAKPVPTPRDPERPPPELAERFASQPEGRPSEGSFEEPEGRDVDTLVSREPEDEAAYASPPEPDALPPDRLIQRLGHPDATERLRAALELGEYGSAAVKALPSLIAALGDPVASVRMAAAQSIAGVGMEDETAQAVAPLVRALADPSPLVRFAAASSLGEVGYFAYSEATEALRRALDDSDERVRAAAADSLELLGSS